MGLDSSEDVQYPLLAARLTISMGGRAKRADTPGF